MSLTREECLEIVESVRNLKRLIRYSISRYALIEIDKELDKIKSKVEEKVEEKLEN